MRSVDAFQRVPNGIGHAIRDARRGRQDRPDFRGAAIVQDGGPGELTMSAVDTFDALIETLPRRSVENCKTVRREDEFRLALELEAVGPSEAGH